MTVVGQSQPVIYGYDNANRLTSVAQGTVSVGLQYDSANRAQTVTLPNGIVQTYGFDAANELTSISYDNGAIHIGDLAYDYDAGGRRVSQNGSFATLAIPPSVTGTSYNAADQLSSWGGSSSTYDNNGNQTTLGSSVYGWNARNQLVSTSNGNSTFSYDALGRRTSTTIGGVTNTYQYNGLNPVMVNGSLMLAGLGLDQNFARITSGTVTSFLTDALGSTLALTNSSAATTASYSYDPYGNVSASGSDSTPFQFTGRENDGAANLYYYRARYYNPAFGQFISADPLGLAAGINPYAYAGGSPTRFIDPLGLCYDEDYESNPATDASGINWKFFWHVAPVSVALFIPIADAAAAEYVTANGISFPANYYDKLWAEGRPAPFLTAQEILDTYTSMVPDNLDGFFNYSNGVLNMIYNPWSGLVWHIGFDF
jgi:RHS repeat-associated protein